MGGALDWESGQLGAVPSSSIICLHFSVCTNGDNGTVPPGLKCLEIYRGELLDLGSVLLSSTMHCGE